MDYPIEAFTEPERATLTRHCSNLDEPVFALLDLPETVKGALFARYSRYPGTLRRLLLDEFAGDLPEPTARSAGGGAADADPSDASLRSAADPSRAEQLYERIFLGYGDDSVAQLGGAHIACEWVSNVLTKILQRPRLAAYLEQSTRYIAYDRPMPQGGYRYWSDPALGPRYRATLDGLFDTYAEALPRVARWVADRYPAAAGDPPRAHARAAGAKALDLLRGLLPAAALSHMGIYASGQAYEALILHLLAHPLPEAREYGTMILEAVRATVPSFVARVTRADRGGRWIDYLRARAAAGETWAQRLDLGPSRETAPTGPSVRLLHVDGSEEDLLCALLFEASAVSEPETRAAIAELGGEERARMLRDLVGDRENRRHRPGRGFEAVRYRFEIVADYGAFRDLQRHRMLTVQWQALSPDLGAEVPREIDAAGLGVGYRRALAASAAEYARLRDAGHGALAPYALCLGYRMRFVLDLNAREAMQLIELRSGREGHPSYRAVAHEMHARIAAVHPAVAAAMGHVDLTSEPRLERILAEMRAEVRATASG